MEHAPEERALTAHVPARISPVLGRFLAAERYEDALNLLRSAQLERPGSMAIARGIMLLEKRLVLAHVRQLGDLSRRPRLCAGADMLATLPPGELAVALKIDGDVSFADLLDRAGSHRYKTAQRLAALLDRGVVSVPEAEPTMFVEGIAVSALAAPSPAPAPSPPPPPPLPHPLRRTRSVDCDRTAQIALVPDAQALLNRARRARRARSARATGSRWLVTCACVWLGGSAIVAGAVWRDPILSTLSAAARTIAAHFAGW